MLDLINFEFRYDFKNRLLLCLINNYYSKHYENNKNCKILFISQDKSKLMQNYSTIYELIKNFNVNDIYTLKKFYQGKFREKKNIFTNLKEKEVNYKTLLEGIKNEYKENKSIYFNRFADSTGVKDSINVIFSTGFSMNSIKNKYLIKDIFILDNLSKYRLQNNYDNIFIGGIKQCIVSYKNVQSIGNTIFNKNRKIILNLYVNDDMEVIDYIESELINSFRDEVEDEDD